MENIDMQFNDYGDMEPYFVRCDDPSEIWDGRVSKRIQRKQYAKWLLNLSDWKVFVTLTFRDQLYVDPAIRLFNYFKLTLNRDLFGKNFFRITGESYFSYVLALEYQIRGDVHFHLLADRSLNFKLIHEFWNDRAGFAKTEIIRSKYRAIRYVVKYIVKNSTIDVQKSDWKGEPLIHPEWWKSELDLEFMISSREMNRKVIQGETQRNAGASLDHT
jgi:hypothetical protein